MPRMKAPPQRYSGIPWTSQLGGKINSQENVSDTFKNVVRTGVRSPAASHSERTSQNPANVVEFEQKNYQIISKGDSKKCKILDV